MSVERAQDRLQIGMLEEPRENLYCLHCRYNLRGLSGDPVRCPECGRSHPRAVQRWGRRRRLQDLRAWADLQSIVVVPTTLLTLVVGPAALSSRFGVCGLVPILLGGSIAGALTLPIVRLTGGRPGVWALTRYQFWACLDVIVTIVFWCAATVACGFALGRLGPLAIMAGVVLGTAATIPWVRWRRSPTRVRRVRAWGALARLAIRNG